MPRDAKPSDGRSLRTSVTVLRSLVRAIAVMSSKLIIRFASPFLRHPRASCARATKTAILAGRRNCAKGSEGPSERSAFPPGGMSSGQGTATSPWCPRSRRTGPAGCGQQRPPNCACRRLQANTRRCHGHEGPVRRLWSCTVRSAWVSGATLRTTWASDAMLIFAARERKVRALNSTGRWA